MWLNYDRNLSLDFETGFQKCQTIKIQHLETIGNV